MGGSSNMLTEQLFELYITLNIGTFIFI